MLAEIYREELPLLPWVKGQPHASIIMPFDPKMVSKGEIAHRLKIAADKISQELDKSFDSNTSTEVLDKLRRLIEHLDYTTHKKSVAICVSLAVEKIYYLNISVTEKVMVDTSFEIRDIVRSKKSDQKFLLLVISAKKEKIFVGSNEKLKQIVCNNSINVKRDLPEPVANFSDPKAEKEVELNKFLSYIDKGLDYILKLYPVPLFILAAEKIIGHFKQKTKHYNNITGFLHGNFDDATENDLRKAIEPLIKNWKFVKDKNMISKLAAAKNEQRLATGMYDVWKQANRKHGQLLVVEEDFYCPAFVSENGETVFTANGINDDALVAKDAVDDIIEKVLENGGDVEFVDELKEFNRIALIESTNYEQ